MNFVESAIKCAKNLDNVLIEISTNYDVEMGKIQNEAIEDSTERGISVQDALHNISENLRRICK